MSKYFSLLSFLSVILFVLAVSAFSQDPGIRDTVRIEADSLVTGRSLPVTLTVVNDEPIFTASLGFVFTSIDGGFARYDSVVFIGRMADPTVLNTRFVIPRDSNGVSPDSLLIAGLTILGNQLAPGNTAIAEIYMTGLSTGQMGVDSSYMPEGSLFGLIMFVNNAFISPEFVSSPIEIVEGTEPPVLSVSESLHRELAASTIQFDGLATSPEGFPVTASLEGFTKYDDANLPVNSPSFSFNVNTGQYGFSWNSTSSDLGIWKAVVSACDSAGICITRDVEIQIVENSDFLIEYETLVSSGINYPTALGSGNFDNDLEPEVATSGLGTVGTTMFSLYDNNGSGTFTEVFTGNIPQSHRRGLKVAFLDNDELLDILQFYDEGSERGILAYPGQGNNAFSAPVFSAMPQAWSLVAAMGKFNDDEFLDYVIGGRSLLRVFAGSSTLEFSLLFEMDVVDSIMSLTSADFNEDGYDDLAMGYRQGLKIYLGSQSGPFSLEATYSQMFGSVNIEVTNQGADFNGDNNFDLCVATPSVGNSGSALVVYLGNGDGTFVQRVTRNVLGQIAANAPGDFNNDGLVDIAFVNNSHRYLGILFGDGDGDFTNELRYNVPVFDPSRIISADADLDGDMDLIVNALRAPDGSSLILYENQTNPAGFTSMSVDFSGEDNAQMELVSPSNKVLNRVGNSMPSANYYRRNINLNDKLDDFANMNLVENGDYVLTVRPDPSQPVGTPFSVEFNIDGQLYRLAKNEVMSGTKYDFALSLGGGMGVAPRSGSFIYVNPPAFSWPNKANVDFQLAADIDFSTMIVDSTVNITTFQLAGALQANDTTTYYWRIRPTGSTDFGSIYAFNLIPSGSSCGDVDGIAGQLNIFDLTYLVDRFFRGGPAPPNLENADLNNDGALNILDLTLLVDYIFRGGLPPVCS